MKKDVFRPLAFIARCAAALATGAALMLAAPRTEAGTILVKLDQAKVVKLPQKAQTLIVGNPIIADVTMLKSGGNMVITGKGFGETNLIVLDNAGNLITESTVRVEAGSGSLLIVQRGTDRESYSCSPRCQPSYQLGDSKAFTADASAGISEHNRMSDPGGH